jgi:hypothetical protein
VLLLVAVCVALVNCQTQDDDEVDIHVPGYNHKFFSGIDVLMQGIFHSVS